ncbi:MAG: hypothetical protein ABFR75_11430 [Acidobacteriota bacterium]
MIRGNVLSNSLRILGLNDTVTVDEIRKMYISKTTQLKFQSIFLLNDDLKREFVKYHEAYVISLREMASVQSGINPDFYPGDQVFTLLLNQGIYFLIKENLLKAGEKLEEAARIKSNNVITYIYLGIILMKRKSYYASERYLLKSVDLDPENEYGWLFLAANYLKANQLNKALHTLDKVRTMAPVDPDLISEINEINKLIIDEMSKDKKNSFIKKLFDK